jgi:hypothetical protein
MLLILDVLLILARDRLKQNLVAARKRKEEAERAIEQAAQSWVLKAPAVYTAVQVCGFWRLRVEESLGMERIPKLGLDFCQAVVVKRISPVNS